MVYDFAGKADLSKGCGIQNENLGNYAILNLDRK